ncbi:MULTISPECIES: protein-disulfide reductase DsbD family protein [Myxococcus]|nr:MULTISPECIES: cytochrome c biogenesis protein CcdA [Myxococcus]QPM77516.1 thioredoxin family protein [Myxococcus xanthus]QVW66583.1 thioredoxin family protein [Myxococcus xanthus DZ2]QZZ52664.1 Thiol:disulfide interchange protein DsbD [Myxococcus xanthus]UEO07289.1 thioredoxin family protein [Myxococcus xanthus DZ2]UYI12368.1 thioredoxin family protein [Myxococcus xanthus]
MDAKKLGVMAVLAGVAVAVVPWLLPTGPNANLDAARFLEAGSLAVGAAVVFAGGLLTALTPCVYPLIPITVSVFGARKTEGRGRALLLTSSYIVGMGVVFSALGVLAAKTGQAFGSMLGHPAVVTGLAVFLLLLATSMFGAFELALPSSFQTKLNAVGGAGVAGAFLMGSVSGFLAAPCTGPVLTGLLAFVAKSANTTLGASLLFVYALGIGVPFFLIGVFTVRLPRGGVWMEWVKSVLGIMLVALAFSYLKDAFPWARDVVKGLGLHVGRVPGAVIAALLVAVGVALGAVHRSFKEGAREFSFKALGVALVVAALVLRGGALDGGPVGTLWVSLGLAEPARAPAWQWHHVMPAKQATFSPEAFDQVLAQAKAEGRPVLIDFFADWCAACKELDRDTYPAQQVISESDEGRFLNIKIDATNSEDSLDALLERFGVEGLPTVAFISPEGKVLTQPRVTGFLAPSPFATEMKKARCTDANAC